MSFSQSDHIVTSYGDELTRLAESISEMGGLVEVAIVNGTQALLKLDRDLAQVTITGDKVIDERQRRIDEMAISMIARRQPMASDLRSIITAIHVASDLERVGDMAKQLAKRSLKIDGLTLQPQLYNGIRHMTDLILRQIKEALDAYATRDADAAVQVCNRDDEVDAMHTSLFRELLTYMLEDPRNITPCTHLLFCAKSLERIGDHATNIAEHAFFLQKGRHLGQDIEEFHRTQAMG